MKKFIISLLSFFIFLSFGCSQQDENTTYPAIIEINDYLLTGTTCNWQNVELDTMYLINSNEELLKYVSCQGNALPTIDFDKYSLLLVRGVNTKGIHSITRDFEQISINEYKFVIDITSDMTTIAQGWRVAVLTAKLHQNAVVKLDLRKH